MEPKPSRIIAEELLHAEPEGGSDTAETPKDHTITIDIGEITGLKPVYPLSELVLTLTFGEDTLFTSEKLSMAETIAVEQYISITVAEDDLDLMNKLLSMPLLFSLLEYQVPVPQETIMETGQGSQATPGTGKILWRSEESILDLEQALFGQKMEIPSDGVARKSNKKSEKSDSQVKTKSVKTKSSQGSKESKQTGKSKGQAEESELGPGPIGPQTAGTAVIDMSSLFLGEASIVESLVLKAPAGQPLDDRMMSAGNLPQLHVMIHLDEPLPTGNMFHFTVESIYNLPKLMSNKMEYKLVLGLPTEEQFRLVPFDSYDYMEKPREPFSYKKYYGTTVLSNVALKDDFDNVKWTVLDYEHAWLIDYPRLEFNTLKGECVSDDAMDSFKYKLSRHRCLGLELYMINPSVMGSIQKEGQSKKSSAEGKQEPADSKKSSKVGSKLGSKKGSKVGKKDKGKKGSKTAISETTEKPEEEYLHLMAFINISRLLYPGEQKTRVACELRTFNMQEFEEKCGIKDSFFRPKPPKPEPPPIKGDPEHAKKDTAPTDKKSQKSSKASKETKDTKKGKKGQGDLRSKLPQPPVPPPPSEPVYNEDGYPTFIILEFEFRFPLNPKREVEDLHEELSEILQNCPQPPVEPRIFKSKYVTEDLFQNSIKSLFQDIKQHYLEYIKENGKANDVLEFMTYLTGCDKYQVYLNTLTKYASMFSSVTKKFNPEFSKDEYHAFIGEVYVDLVELLNTSLTYIGIAGDEFSSEPSGESVDDLLLYAKEATEIDAVGLAQHYYLKRISNDDTNAASWLDYGVYKLYIGEVDAAEECVIEALKNDASNRDCLVFFALLQARKGKCAEAETCLLNVTINHPKWLEGWMALHCVYLRCRNYEGMEVCYDMAEKYAKEPDSNTFIELAWCVAKLPNKFLLRAMKYLINLRLLDEAELLLAEELYQRNTDLLEYLLAIICLLKREFEHAEGHIVECFKMAGCSYEKNMIKGHIFMGLNKLDCALVEYEKVFKSTQVIPFDESVYLVYVRAGLCYSALGMHQSARKIFLKASEAKGTPYSWLATGVLYYHQHDFLSAEECLKISNTMDNVLPETWVYLSLVNFKLGRPDEATSCYQQALKYNLQNADLLTEMQDEVKEWEKQN